MKKSCTLDLSIKNKRRFHIKKGYKYTFFIRNTSTRSVFVRFWGNSGKEEMIEGGDYITVTCPSSGRDAPWGSYITFEFEWLWKFSEETGTIIIDCISNEEDNNER